MAATPKRKVGRPPYAPTKRDRGLVEVLVACGLTHAQIGGVLKISEDTLAKYFPEEIASGHAKVLAKVAGGLARAAMKGDRTAQIFWLKTRAGWREVSRVENTGADGGPMEMNIGGQVTIYIPDNGRGGDGMGGGG